MSALPSARYVWSDRLDALEGADAVIDSAVSLVFDQAENRLHVQKALLLLLLVPKEMQRYFHLDKWAARR